MSITVQEFLNNRPELKLVAIQYKEFAQNALDKMNEQNLSQLPVLNNQEELIGMITSNSVLKALKIFEITISNLKVSHATIKVPKYRVGDDISEVFSDIKRHGAVIITDKSEKRATGIITVYDMLDYYSKHAENLILLNNIEISLKEHIRAAFKDSWEELDQAIDDVSNRDKQLFLKFSSALEHYNSEISKDSSNSKSLKSDLNQHKKKIFERHFLNNKKNKSLDDLTLNDFIAILLDKTEDKYCADNFNGLDNRAIKKMLEEVRNVRNSIFHFKRDLISEDYQKLRFCSDWLAMHTPPDIETDTDNIENIEDFEKCVSTINKDKEDDKLEEMNINTDSTNENKYLKFIIELRGCNQQRVTYRFKDIENIIDDKLPKAARQDRSWWSNDDSQPWLKANWQVLSSNLLQEKVTFIYKTYADKYKTFFIDLLHRLKKEASFGVRIPYQDGRNYSTVAIFPNEKNRWLIYHIHLAKAIKVLE